VSAFLTVNCLFQRGFDVQGATGVQRDMMSKVTPAVAISQCSLRALQELATAGVTWQAQQQCAVQCLLGLSECLFHCDLCLQRG
jgi:hypothetical protein